MASTDGLISPAGIPGGDLDPEAITTAASDLRSVGGSLAQAGDDVLTAWHGLSVDVYDAPEAAQLRAASIPVSTRTAAAENRMQRVADLLEAFAEQVRDDQQKLDGLREDAQELRDGIRDGSLLDDGEADWQQDPKLVRKHDRIWHRVAGHTAALAQAEAECAAAIRAIMGETVSAEPSVTAEDLRAPGASNPWGDYQEGRLDCVGNTSRGVENALEDALGGLFTLVSYDSDTWEWGDWDGAGDALAGLFASVGLLASVVPMSINAVRGTTTDADRANGRALEEMVDSLWWNTVRRPEEWERNFWQSAGHAGTNVATIFGGLLTAGAKAAKLVPDGSGSNHRGGPDGDAANGNGGTSSGGGAGERTERATAFRESVAALIAAGRGDSGSDGSTPETPKNDTSSPDAAPDTPQRSQERPDASDAAPRSPDIDADDAPPVRDSPEVDSTPVGAAPDADAPDAAAPPVDGPPDARPDSAPAPAPTPALGADRAAAARLELERVAALEADVSGDVQRFTEAVGIAPDRLDVEVKPDTDYLRDLQAEYDKSRAETGGAAGERATWADAVFNASRDNLRYTVRLDDAEFSAKVDAMSDQLAAAGYRLSEFRNPAVTGDRFTGVETIWIDESGMKIRVDFDTDASLAARDGGADAPLPDGAASLSAGDQYVEVLKLDGTPTGRLALDTDVAATRAASTHNADADRVMLGKYKTDETSYTVRAGDDHTYFDLGATGWDETKLQQGLSNQDMFTLYNVPFLDDAIAAKKFVDFSHDPSGDSGFLGQELLVLKQAGYLFDPRIMTAGPPIGVIE